jgi:hypothetical protein
MDRGFGGGGETRKPDILPDIPFHKEVHCAQVIVAVGY